VELVLEALALTPRPTEAGMTAAFRGLDQHRDGRVACEEYVALLRERQKRQ